MSRNNPGLRHLLQIVGGIVIGRAVGEGLDSNLAEMFRQILTSTEIVDMLIGVVITACTYLWFKVESKGWFKGWFK